MSGFDPKGTSRGPIYCAAQASSPAPTMTNLVARVQGYLESIDYQDGATVKKGTPLFGIERDIYQATLDQTKAQWPTIRRWPQKRRSI